MFGIDTAINNAIGALGSGFLTLGNSVMQLGAAVWNGGCDAALVYARYSPMDMTTSWGVVTGNIYNTMLAIGVSLSALYFVLGWLNESIDIRTTFTLENMFRFFIRYILAASLVVNALSLVEGVTRCSVALVAELSAEAPSAADTSVFSGLKEELEEEDADGITWLFAGIIGFLASFIACLVIIVCGVQIILSVLGRLFRILLCIPFAPVALAGFAGGREFSQTGIAWIKTFIGYSMEAVVIVLAIAVSRGLTSDNFISAQTTSPTVETLLTVCNYCLPMLTCCACVKGAESISRKCLGLQ